MGISFWAAGSAISNINALAAEISEAAVMTRLAQLVQHISLYMPSLAPLINEVSTYVICHDDGAFIVDALARAVTYGHNTNEMPRLMLEIGKGHVVLLANLFEGILDCVRASEFQADVIQNHVTRLNNFTIMSKHFIFSDILGCSDVRHDWESVHANSASEFYSFCEIQCLSNGIGMPFDIIKDLLSLFIALEQMLSIDRCERIYEMLCNNTQAAEILNGVVESIRAGLGQNP